MSPSSDRPHLRWVAWLVALTLGQAASAHGGQVDWPATFGGAYSLTVTSIREARQASTVRQQYDFSCGSAAIATLLSHHYGRPTGEPDVFKGMLKAANETQVRRHGFSMLDMKRYLESLGIEAQGFEASIDDLSSANVPGIVLVNQRGYRHFVVVKGVSEDRVLIGDPALGTRSLSRSRFDAMRDGAIVLVVTDRQGRFNAPEDWRASPKAPLASAGRAGGLTSPWLRLERSDL